MNDWIPIPDPAEVPELATGARGTIGHTSSINFGRTLTIIGWARFAELFFPQRGVRTLRIERVLRAAPFQYPAISCRRRRRE